LISSADAMTGISLLPAMKRTSSMRSMFIGFSTATTSAFSASASGTIW
jgi:hypothetical protein